MHEFMHARSSGWSKWSNSGLINPAFGFRNVAQLNRPMLRFKTGISAEIALFRPPAVPRLRQSGAKSFIFRLFGLLRNIMRNYVPPKIEPGKDVWPSFVSRCPSCCRTASGWFTITIGLLRILRHVAASFCWNLAGQ